MKRPEKAVIGFILSAVLSLSGPSAARQAKGKAARRAAAPRSGAALRQDARAGGSPDWLIDPSSFKARITKDDARKEVVLGNGLIRRVFRLAPNAATVDIQNLMTGESILRAVEPEAIMALDGSSFEVGGLKASRSAPTSSPTGSTR
jgi:hypothetical protein